MSHLGSNDPRVELGTVGELRALNYLVPGVDLESAKEEASVSVPLETAQALAHRALISRGATDADASAILANYSDLPSRKSQQATNIRAVLRIEMLLGVLFQSTSEVRTQWYSQENGLLYGQTPLQYMLDFGPKRLEELLSGWVYG